MKVSDYIAEYLVSKNVTTVFGYIGGAITHLVDSIEKNKNIQFIQVYHEQTAAIAAEGVSRVSQAAGVAIATSGPGATNLITGIADAYFDSIPTVFITGQVNTFEYKYEKPIRQQGFQETDIVAIVKPVTKYAVLVEDPAQIGYELDKAFHIATSGRPGPVLIDIPMNVQRAEISTTSLKRYIDPIPPCEGPLDIEDVVITLRAAKRPLLLLGGGVLSAGAQELVASLVKKYHFPVVVSLMGKGAVSEDTTEFVGMLGSYGNRCANLALATVDVLLALGTRLDTRQTGTMYKEFVKNGIIIHVDIDQHELTHHRVQRQIQKQGDVKHF